MKLVYSFISGENLSWYNFKKKKATNNKTQIFVMLFDRAILLLGIQTKEIIQKKQNNTGVNKTSADVFVTAKPRIIKQHKICTMVHQQDTRQLFKQTMKTI